jgi:hypothetical protein
MIPYKQKSNIKFKTFFLHTAYVGKEQRAAVPLPYEIGAHDYNYVWRLKIDVELINAWSKFKMPYLININFRFCRCLKECRVPASGKILTLIFANHSFIFKVTLVTNKDHWNLSQQYLDSNNSIRGCIQTAHHYSAAKPFTSDIFHYDPY